MKIGTVLKNSGKTHKLSQTSKLANWQKKELIIRKQQLLKYFGSWALAMIF